LRAAGDPRGKLSELDRRGDDDGRDELEAAWLGNEVARAVVTVRLRRRPCPSAIQLKSRNGT
jgi:hypothetical protein